ncbi:MAG: DUF692 domain-containing protein [Rhodobacteraceae bacterium]|nr:DUF692 domain-containing protein [Paracoccaceae bacterium]MCY4196756.1 DUF692 domain-containing protein [Paracoccaceae bacterium]
MTLPAAPGVGFKSRHFESVVNAPGSVKWLEIHAENFMGEGGRQLAQLRKLREVFPISCHGVGLSIGGQAPLDQEHLRRLRYLVDWLEPASFSEHLAWSTHEGHYLADLLPLPYTTKTLRHVCTHIDEVQEALGCPMLLENPSAYLEFADAEMDEIEFLSNVVKQTGCGLLLDVNNVHVSAINRHFDGAAYIRNFPLEHVGEIHLGGHEQDEDCVDDILLIDNHAAPVADPVWKLFDLVIEKAGALPTLIEWDSKIPEWSILVAEANRAAGILQREQIAAA